MPRDRTGEGRRRRRSLLPSRLCGQVGRREGVLMQGGCEGVSMGGGAPGTQALSWPRCPLPLPRQEGSGPCGASVSASPQQPEEPVPVALPSASLVFPVKCPCPRPGPSFSPMSAQHCLFLLSSEHLEPLIPPNVVGGNSTEDISASKGTLGLWLLILTFTVVPRYRSHRPCSAAEEARGIGQFSDLPRSHCCYADVKPRFVGHTSHFSPWELCAP